MNNINNIKVFTKVGLMKDSKWLKGIVLEEYENIFIVETHGNKISIDKRNVKPIKYMEYDDKTGTYPELQSFVDNNWEELKNYILDSLKEFFPEIKIKINDEDKIIECEEYGILVGGAIKETENIVSFQEVPAWEITLLKTIPATRHEPEDVSESIVAVESGNISTAGAFIDCIWKLKSQSYWENKWESKWEF